MLDIILIANISGYSPKKSYETFDSLVVVLKSEKLAKKCRKELVKNNINTKILPEATTWHFAKYWSHMEALVKSH